MTTIVSAFYADANKNRCTETYIKLGQQLIDIQIPKVIFCSKDILPKLNSNEYTKFIIYELEYPKENFELPSQRNPPKDTQEYLFLMNQKTLFVQKAIELDAFKTNQFLWLDFGILHVCDPNTFVKDVTKACNAKYDNVRIATIWDVSNIQPLTDRVQWYCAGGVFGGNKTALVQFHSLAQMELQIIRPKLVWEVNIYAMVMKKYTQLFSCFQSDHNSSIIRNY